MSEECISERNRGDETERNPPEKGTFSNGYKWAVWVHLDSAPLYSITDGANRREVFFPEAGAGFLQAAPAVFPSDGRGNRSGGERGDLKGSHVHQHSWGARRSGEMRAHTQPLTAQDQ